MSVPPSHIVALSALQPGDTGVFYAQLFEKSKSKTYNNRPFYTCTFRDRHRNVSAMAWSDSFYFEDCERDWQIGQFFKIQATYKNHPKYGEQIEIARIRRVNDDDRQDGFNEADFQSVTRFNPDEMHAELLEIVQAEIACEPLRQLVQALLVEHAELLKRAPASMKQFYPFPGGLLEHTLNVVKNCLPIVRRYREYYDQLSPSLNVDIVIAAAALHELGRIRELELPASSVELASYTVEGRLFGNHLLCRDLVRDAALKIPEFPDSLRQLLEHTLLSYLEIPAWGSPRLPMIPEVLILHHIDDLDAKMEMYVRCLLHDHAPGPFTEADPVLKKPLLKQREW